MTKLMHSQPTPERRRAPRLEHNIPLKLSSADVELVTETKNLSSSGAYCRLNKHIEPMTKLKIHLLLPVKKNNRMTTRKISCQGVVVRSEAVAGQDYFNTAIFFSDLSVKDTQTLKDFVDVMLEMKKVKNVSSN